MTIGVDGCKNSKPYVGIEKVGGMCVLFSQKEFLDREEVITSYLDEEGAYPKNFVVGNYAVKFRKMYGSKTVIFECVDKDVVTAGKSFVGWTIRLHRLCRKKAGRGRTLVFFCGKDFLRCFE